MFNESAETATVKAPAAPKVYGDDDMLTTPEAAAVLRFVPGTLCNMRSNGTGPDYRRHGRKIVYRYGDLMTWSKARSSASAM